MGLSILYWQHVLRVLGGDKEPLARHHSWGRRIFSCQKLCRKNEAERLQYKYSVIYASVLITR